MFAATLTVPDGWPRPVDPHGEPVTYRVYVRMSKGGGLPGNWPDVLGLAIRIPDVLGENRPVDILLSSTGRGRLTRWLPMPSRDWRSTAYGSITPFRCGARIIAVAAAPAANSPSLPSSLQALIESVRALPMAFDVVTATPLRDWHQVGRLVVNQHLPDVNITFDPVLNAHPYLTPIPRLLSVTRKKAYAGSRRGSARPAP